MVQQVFYRGEVLALHVAKLEKRKLCLLAKCSIWPKAADLLDFAWEATDFLAKALVGHQYLWFAAIDTSTLCKIASTESAVQGCFVPTTTWEIEAGRKTQRLKFPYL